MATTFMELVNRTLRRLNEVEIDEIEFDSVRGVQAAAKDAVQDAVRKINSQKFEWPFNAADGSQVLTVGQELYSWPTDLKIVDWDSFYIEKSTPLSTNTHPLFPINRNEWYRKHKAADLDVGTDGRSKPDWAFPSDSGGFGVTPSPSAAYTIKFRYWIRPDALVDFDDVCTIPSEFDHVITDGAMMHMFMFMDNDERAKKAEFDFNFGLSWMSYLLIPKDFYASDSRMGVNNAR